MSKDPKLQGLSELLRTAMDMHRKKKWHTARTMAGPMGIAKGFLNLAALVALGWSDWVLSAGQLPGSNPHSEQVFQPTVPNIIMPPGPTPDGMVWFPGGEFSWVRLIHSEMR